VSGECAPVGTTILSSPTPAGDNATMSNPATCTAAIHDVTVNASASTTLVDNPTTGQFSPSDVGRTLTETTPATRLPSSPATKITGFTDANTVTLNQASLTCTGGTLHMSALGANDKNLSLDAPTVATARMVQDADDSILHHWTSATAQFDSSDIGVDILRT